MCRVVDKVEQLKTKIENAHKLDAKENRKVRSGQEIFSILSIKRPSWWEYSYTHASSESDIISYNSAYDLYSPFSGTHDCSNGPSCSESKS